MTAARAYTAAPCLCGDDRLQHRSSMRGGQLTHAGCRVAGCGCDAYTPVDEGDLPPPVVVEVTPKFPARPDAHSYANDTAATPGGALPSFRPSTMLADEVLAEAARSSNWRIRTMAAKAKALVDDVRTSLAADRERAEAAAEVERLREQLAAAKKKLSAANGKPSGSAQSPATAATIRTWAHEVGMACPPVGRVPTLVIDAYNAAHGRSA